MLPPLVFECVPCTLSILHEYKCKTYHHNAPFPPSTDTPLRMFKFVSQFNLLVQISLVPFKLWTSNLAGEWEYIVSRCSVNLGPISLILWTISLKGEFSYHLIYRQQRLVKQLQIGYRACRGEFFNGTFLSLYICQVYYCACWSKAGKINYKMTLLQSVNVV